MQRIISFFGEIARIKFFDFKWLIDISCKILLSNHATQRILFVVSAVFIVLVIIVFSFIAISIAFLLFTCIGIGIVFVFSLLDIIFIVIAIAFLLVLPDILLGTGGISVILLLIELILEFFNKMLLWFRVLVCNRMFFFFFSEVFFDFKGVFIALFIDAVSLVQVHLLIRNSIGIE